LFDRRARVERVPELLQEADADVDVFSFEEVVILEYGFLVRRVFGFRGVSGRFRGVVSSGSRFMFVLGSGCTRGPENWFGKGRGFRVFG